MVPKTYKEIIDLPNVKFINPQYDNKILIKNSDLVVMDTTNGQVVKYLNFDSITQEVEDNEGQIKGGAKFRDGRQFVK